MNNKSTIKSIKRIANKALSIEREITYAINGTNRCYFRRYQDFRLFDLYRLIKLLEPIYQYQYVTVVDDKLLGKITAFYEEFIFELDNMDVRRPGVLYKLNDAMEDFLANH